MRLVSNKPLREAFLRSPQTANELAAILGYYKTSRGHRMPDQSRVLRSLGLRKEHERGGTRSVAFITEEKALAIGGLLGLDPVDMDL